jgi:SAM-dependent methyltransferase
MKADVICFAEDIPFADDSFDVVVTRIAPHHFADIERAVHELARVSKRFVVIEDTLYSSPDVEAAEKLRDPTHVRNLSEPEWRSLLEAAGLVVDHVEHFAKTHPLDDWLARTDCTGAEAERVRELLAEVTDEDGLAWHDTKIIVRGVKDAS